MGLLGALLEAYTYADCYVGGGDDYEGVSTGYLNHPYHSTGYDFGPLCVSKESTESESEYRKVDRDSVYKECIDVLTDAQTDLNFTMKSTQNPTFRPYGGSYHEKYILKKNGETVIEALIKHVSHFCVYSELRMLTYKQQTYRYGHISSTISVDSHDKLINLFENFNSDRAVVLARKAR